MHLAGVFVVCVAMQCVVSRLCAGAGWVLFGLRGYAWCAWVQLCMGAAVWVCLGVGYVIQSQPLQLQSLALADASLIVYRRVRRWSLAFVLRVSPCQRVGLHHASVNPFI